MFSEGSIKNENLIKLRELSDKICGAQASKTNYKGAVDEMVDVIEHSEDMIEDEENTDNKIKCYESMFHKLKLILNNFKIH
jgi:hypothetical protein